MINHDELERTLTRLRAEHRLLDERISKLMREQIVDHIMIQRLKKQKLNLKDQIKHIEDELFPDIIA